MPHLSWMFGIVLVFALTACGGDDDAQAEDVAGVAAKTPGAGANDADGGGDNGTDAETGSAIVVIGDETFKFNIKCQFGTGIIRGGGSADDGTPAFLDAGMPIDDSGKPANDPSEVGVTVRVGIDTLWGSSQYQYRVGPTNGSMISYSDDGSRAEGKVQFEYASGDGAREGLTYGDKVEGTFKVTCP